MELRGYDSYQVSLGDEMRGERASLGKSLEEAERDMRIKVKIITAIEDCDLDGFPNQSVISGYVRSYARYLGMDPDACFERFCHESGYRSPTAFQMQSQGTRSAGRKATVTLQGPGAHLAQSRFAATAPASNRFMPMISLGALTSTLALLGLIGGLGYGGYALLQDIQRVGFAPLPEAPTVVADAPRFDAPDVDMDPLPLPEASDYQGGGVLAALAAPIELAPMEGSLRDGPISAIDPSEAGMFVRRSEPPLAAAEAFVDPVGAFEDYDAAAVDQAIAAIAADLPRGIALHASEEAWIRVREGDDTVLFEGTLSAGERFDLPERAIAPILRAGNAGGIFIYIDGVAYGPVGERGSVARGVSLKADDVRSSIPQAEPEVIQPAQTVGTQQRADASDVRN